MKRIVIGLVLLFATASPGLAQLKVGVSGGIPLGDASDFYDFAAGLDIYYMFGESNDAFLKLGVTSGITNYFGGDIEGIEIENIQFIPIAVAGRMSLLGTLTFGADIGYGIGINIEDEGGPIGRLVLGLDIGNTLEVNTYYQLVKVINGADFAAIGLGLLVEL